MSVDWQQLQDIAPELSVLVDLVIALAASTHVILHKTDTRAATAWVGLIWLVPFLGSILYVFLGINRIQRSLAYRSTRRRIRPPTWTVSSGATARA